MISKNFLIISSYPLGCKFSSIFSVSCDSLLFSFAMKLHNFFFKYHIIILSHLIPGPLSYHILYYSLFISLLSNTNLSSTPQSSSHVSFSFLHSSNTLGFFFSVRHLLISFGFFIFFCYFQTRTHLSILVQSSLPFSVFHNTRVPQVDKFLYIYIFFSLSSSRGLLKVLPSLSKHKTHALHHLNQIQSVISGPFSSTRSSSPADLSSSFHSPSIISWST